MKSRVKTEKNKIRKSFQQLTGLPSFCSLLLYLSETILKRVRVDPSSAHVLFLGQCQTTADICSGLYFVHGHLVSVLILDVHDFMIWVTSLKWVGSRFARDFWFTAK